MDAKDAELIESDFDDAQSSEDEEDKSQYRSGGYHWVEIGDVYNSKYLVHRKLGWGHFSTVWLVSNIDLPVNHPRKVLALKILKSAPNYLEAAYEEVDILKKIAKQPHNSLGKRYVVQLVDSFEMMGPHGTHVCIVMETMGKSLLSLIHRSESRSETGGIPVDIVKRIVFQIALSLHFLHDTCNLVHTDLKPENFLLSRRTPLDSKALEAATLEHLKNVKENGPAPVSSPLRRVRNRSRRRQMSISSLQTRLSQGSKGEVKKSPFLIADQGGPVQQIPGLPTTLPSLSRNPSSTTVYIHEEMEVKICDMGNAVPINFASTETISTTQYRSPEVLLGMKYDYKTDIWSLGCMIFELLTGDYCFDPEDENGVSVEASHLQMMIELLGQIPEAWAQEGHNYSKYFSSEGLLLHKKVMGHWGPKLLLHRRYHFSEKDASEIALVLENLLKYNPQQRWSAKDLLKCEWLRAEAKKHDISSLYDGKTKFTEMGDGIEHSTTKEKGTEGKRYEGPYRSEDEVKTVLKKNDN
mmetsp:Transcript_2810/g.4075  ORF Transcript_2810/g.4075 Transcript_2810/m.4075 type:complete len:524 (+) Transcript_2810:64-1635(+)